VVEGELARGMPITLNIHKAAQRQNREEKIMKKRITIATLIFTGMFAITASAAPSNSAEGLIRNSTSAIVQPDMVQPDIAPASPFTATNLRGGATAEFVTPGACAGVTCPVTDCSCTTFTGTLTGTGYGKVSAVIAITENDDNTTLNGGFGKCFPAAGTATLTTGGLKPSVAVLGLAGSLCEFQAGTASTVNGNFAYSQEAATGGTNKFATSFGTGNLSTVESLDQAPNDNSIPAAISAVGTLQLKH
jgi:hypothetical protein